MDLSCEMGGLQWMLWLSPQILSKTKTRIPSPPHLPGVLDATSPRMGPTQEIPLAKESCLTTPGNQPEFMTGPYEGTKAWPPGLKFRAGHSGGISKLPNSPWDQLRSLCDCKAGQLLYFCPIYSTHSLTEVVPEITPQ